MTFLLTYLYFVVFSGYFLGKAMFVLKSLYLIFWPYLWIKITKIGLGNKEERKIGKSVLYGCLFALFIALLGIVLYKFLYFVFEPFKNNVMNKMKSFDLNNPFLFVLFGVYIFLLNSLIEEYYWRYFIFKGLMLKLNTVISALISSIAFTLHHTMILSNYFPLHLNAFLSFLTFFAGFVWCLIFYRTNSIIGPWVSHIIVDIVIVVFGYKLLF
ncbi:MAG: CPBP family intramembrane metalloprotease [Spirochaetes bacterium]|nr:CPBP family intramembrane metalloprotease [Spirochaetota bacterium]